MKKGYIRNSLDFRYFKWHAIMFLIFLIIGYLGYIFVLGDIEEMLYIVFVSGALFLYCIIRMISLYFIYKKCLFCEVEFKEFHTRIRMIYFEFHIYENDTPRKKYTRTIFSNYYISVNNIEDYLNKKMLIGYVPNKNKVIVIQKVGD